MAGAIVGAVLGLVFGLLLWPFFGNYTVLTTILSAAVVAFDRAIGGEPRGVARALFGRIEELLAGGVASSAARHYSRGVACLRANDWDGALSAFDGAARAMDNLSTAQGEYSVIALCILLGAAGEYERAVDSLVSISSVGTTEGRIDPFLPGIAAHAGDRSDGIPSPFYIGGRKVRLESLMDKEILLAAIEGRPIDRDEITQQCLDSLTSAFINSK